MDRLLGWTDGEVEGLRLGYRDCDGPLLGRLLRLVEGTLGPSLGAVDEAMLGPSLGWYELEPLGTLLGRLLGLLAVLALNVCFFTVL